MIVEEHEFKRGTERFVAEFDVQTVSNVPPVAAWTLTQCLRLTAEQVRPIGSSNWNGDNFCIDGSCWVLKEGLK